jgi:hypothetical protein
MCTNCAETVYSDTKQQGAARKEEWKMAGNWAWEVAQNMSDAKESLNASRGGYSSRVFAYTDEQAAETIKAVEQLIADRYNDIYRAQAALEMYKQFVKKGGPAELSRSWNS